jgi:hypothetical protein
VIINADIEVIGENSFGKVKLGHIIMQNRLLRASVGIVDFSPSIGSYRRSSGWKFHAPNGHDLGSIIFDNRKFYTKHLILKYL